MQRFFAWLIERVLAIPVFFELQQRLNPYQDVKAELADYLAKPGRRILDFGCSTGNGASAILDFKNNACTGIDNHPGYAEAAQRRYPDATFLTMDGRHMDFPDGYFDLVTIIGVLHHMPDDLARDCLQEIRRVLKPDGRVLLVEPVYTPGRFVSSILLSLDRGRFIRPKEGYRALLGPWTFERERFFQYGLHRFVSFAMAKSGTN